MSILVVIDWRQHKKNIKLIEKARTHIIETAIGIEALLDFILTKYFVGNETVIKRGFFQFQVLGKEFFTFHQKIHIFGEIGLHRNPLYGNRFKGLTGKLDYIKDRRNLVAHGISAGLEPNVYFKDKDTPVKLDKAELKTFDNISKFVFATLEEIYFDLAGKKIK